MGQQAQATAAAAGARAGAAAARGALRGMRQSPGGRGARGGPEAPAGARGPALRLPHPARPEPRAALGPRRTPEERGRRFPGGGEAYPGRRLPKKRPPRSGSRVSGSPALASYMEDPRGQKKKGVRLGCRREEKASFPLPKQLNLGVGRRRQLKKKKKKAGTRFIFFFYILSNRISLNSVHTKTRGRGPSGLHPAGDVWRNKEVLSKSKNQIRKAQNENHHLLAPRRSGGVWLELGFKKRKCLQSRTRRLRGGKKVSTSYIPLFPCRAPLVFLSFSSGEKKKAVYFFNPQKALARLFQSFASG